VIPAELDIPPDWEELDLSELHGTLLVVGEPNAGKSSFSRYLYGRMNASRTRVALIDGDPGQATLGPPTTITLALKLDGVPPGEMPDSSEFVRRSFIGSTTPYRHMLPMLVGAARLVSAANQAGVETIVYDTCGLVQPDSGGLSLKQAKIDLLRPETVFAIRNGHELDALLRPLRRSRRTRLVELAPSEYARVRSMATRQAHRASQYRRYFSGSGVQRFNWSKLAVFPKPGFSPGRLVALEDRLGFTLALGVVVEVERTARQVSLLTPLPSPDGVDAIQIGDIIIDTGTFHDRIIS